MYKTAAADAAWLDLFPGVRARFAPITRAALRAARQAAADVFAAADGQPDPADVGEAFSAELIRRGLRGWEGIGRDEDDKPLAFDPAGVERFLADPSLFEAADAAYVVPFVERQAEKNGLSLSPAGTSAGATRAKPTAATAGKSAKTAPMKSTPRRRR